jgi:glycosyltransferase involved in cell wall biosynthesis
LDGSLHALAQHLSADDELLVYYNAFRGPQLFGPGVRERFIRAPRAVVWNQLRLPLALKRDRPDVYLGGAYITPVRSPVPTVMVVHDCIAFRDPSAKPGLEGIYLRHWMKASARSAALVVAVSRWAAGESERYLGLAPERIRVVYSGIDARFSPSKPDPADLAELRRELRIAGDFCLQVGAYEPHKGSAVAAEAVQRVREHGFDLALVRCGVRWRSDPRDGVVDLGWVDDDMLLRLYRHASVVCVVSTHEGFGFPALEAMRCGAPVVASDIPGLREAAGDAAIFVPADDPGALATAIEGLLRSPDHRQKARQEGPAWAANFSWEKNATAMLEVLNEVRGARIGLG